MCAREFMTDVLAGEFEFDDPQRTVLTLNERIFRFSMYDRHAHELYRRHPELDPARAILDDPRLPNAFHQKRLPQIRELLATRSQEPAANREEALPPDPHRGRNGGPEG